MTAYQSAMSDNVEETTSVEIGASRTKEGTVNAIISAYLDCSSRSTSPFKTMAPETQRTRRHILERFRNEHGDKRVFRVLPDGKKEMLLRREKVQQFVNERAATPFAQRNFLNTLRALFAWALSEGRVPDDPTLGVKRAKIRTIGYRTWSEREIEQFESRHPVGTKPRLALAILLYTGQRRGDVVKMGRQHIRRGILTVDQSKTEGGEEAHLEIPLHPKLQEIIEATPSEHLTFLTTHFGKPYSAAGFTNWFREQCKEAGLPKGFSAHGLRKACARRLAEIGCTPHQIAAITGHASLSEVQRYTRAADRKRLAQEAMQKLVAGETVKNGVCKNAKKPFRRKGDR